MATCPECEFDEIDTEDFEEGDTLSCPECGRNLVMVGADEVELADDEEDEELDEDEDAFDDDDEIDDEGTDEEDEDEE
jgi:hypothetical protein